MSAAELTAGEAEFLLAFADDEHLMGQRHTEWIGVAPFLEEDLAFASIGQDELGHAVGLYELVDDDADRLALFRSPADYRSSWLVERPCRDWAEALVRHFLYDSAEQLRWECVRGSRLTVLGDLAARAEREEAYHRRHADALLDGIAADATARARVDAALDGLLPLAVAQFEPVAGESDALASGLATIPWASTVDRWRSVVDARFGGIDWSSVVAPDSAGRTVRSDDFAEVYDSIREVVMLDPDATW